MKRTALILTIALTLQPLGAFAQQKTTITRADELPRRTYKLEGKAVDLVADSEELDRLAAEVKKNLEGDLAKFDIRDNATLSGITSVLMLLDLRQRDYDGALARIARLREL